MGFRYREDGLIELDMPHQMLAKDRLMSWWEGGIRFPREGWGVQWGQSFMHIASWSGSQPFIHELKTSQCNHEYILLRTQGSSHLPVSGVILFMILYFSWTEGAPSYRILLTISPHNKHFKLPYQIIWGKVALRPCCKKQAYLDTKSLATWPRSMLIFDISLHQSLYILMWTEDAVIEFIYKSIFQSFKIL